MAGQFPRSREQPPPCGNPGQQTPAGGDQEQQVLSLWIGWTSGIQWGFEGALYPGQGSESSVTRGRRWVMGGCAQFTANPTRVQHVALVVVLRRSGRRVAAASGTGRPGQEEQMLEFPVT